MQPKMWKRRGENQQREEEEEKTMMHYLVYTKANIPSFKRH